MICYNKEQKLVPFQDMQSLKAITSSNLSLLCFDILMLNRKNLLTEKLSERKNLLKGLLKTENPNNPICYIDWIVLTNSD
jgi:ATP-dependent DNA ligase